MQEVPARTVIDAVDRLLGTGTTAPEIQRVG
jgi:hypothetical protein